MRVIEHKKNELVLIDQDNTVLAVPNTPYFFLKYSRFEGNKISCILSKKPHIIITENKDKEFVCNYNKMQLIVQEEKKINELCTIMINNSELEFVDFFCKNFAQDNQEEILDIFFKPYETRIKKFGYPHYIIDGVFGVDKWGGIYVNNPNKKDFPWDKISLVVSGDVNNYKIIESFDGQDLIMDYSLQILVTKIFYLLNSEKKNDAMFMVQLPKKVQRWIEKEDITASINFEIVEEKKPEIFVPKSYGYFPTPPPVVNELLSHADLDEGMKILEPSAGQGHILDFLKGYDVTCCELFHANQVILKEKGYEITCENFLEFEGFDYFDRVIMNPPFELQQDIDHVNHAFLMLKEGGKLISIMSNSIRFRNNKKSKKFRELVEKNGYFVELPINSFKESGTSVHTVLVVLNKEVI